MAETVSFCDCPLANIGLHRLGDGPSRGTNLRHRRQDRAPGENATIAEILATVRSTLGIRIDISGSTAHQISGAYAGSLRHVLAHLLDGEDFIITTVPTGMSITIVGSNGAGGGPGRFTRQRAGGDNESSPIQGWTPSQILPERPALTTRISTQSPSNAVDPHRSKPLLQMRLPPSKAGAVTQVPVPYLRWPPPNRRQIRFPELCRS